MPSIYAVLIVFPMIFLIVLLFIFQTNTNAISQHQTIMNCPFPLNSAVGTLSVNQDFPQINYTITFDNDTSSYHVTTFECEFDPTSESPSISNRVYTGSNNWYDVTGRASGYLFYISEYFDTIGIRVNAFGNVLYHVLTAPQQITGLVWFTYAEVVLALFIGIGVFMIIRGIGG